jgi:hypothetical protein
MYVNRLGIPDRPLRHETATVWSLKISTLSSLVPFQSAVFCHWQGMLAGHVWHQSKNLLRDRLRSCVRYTSEQLSALPSQDRFTWTRLKKIGLGEEVRK